jgi:hypothetical protein
MNLVVTVYTAAPEETTMDENPAMETEAKTFNILHLSCN